ncbi:hypothetical protein T4D_15062 [Trichinella pseudospiralis]|uniref:Uncharacterized protein n=1 Tax=Trichinella pseudospiralis TaxID=6337 RepID=A0A0V1F6E3_TRIPS|nr:hypothetical protein T4D_15062 [Trichinella pseudospiralis]
MIKHRYGDRYLHNEALEIGFRRLDLSEDLLLIGIFLQGMLYLFYYSTCKNNLKTQNPINHRLESSAKV